MPSNYKKPPVFARDRTWKEAKLAGHHTKEEVYTYAGEKGLEFLVSKTLLDYVATAGQMIWSWPEIFDNFSRVLEGLP